MKFKKVFKGLFGMRLPRQWIGYDQLSKDFGLIRSLWTLFSRKFFHTKKKSSETFEAAMQRLSLTEEDLQRRMQMSKKLIIFYLTFAGMAGMYTIYIFFKSSWITFFLMIMLMLLFIAYGCREHFNYFQMKRRRLGCTVREWLLWICSWEKKR